MKVIAALLLSASTVSAFAPAAFGTRCKSGKTYQVTILEFVLFCGSGS